jgi:hypothetical protein
MNKITMSIAVLALLGKASGVKFVDGDYNIVDESLTQKTLDILQSAANAGYDKAPVAKSI